VINAVYFLIALSLLGVAMFYFLRSRELAAQLMRAEDLWEKTEGDYVAELAKLEKLRHIPDVIERAKKAKADGDSRLAEAQRKAVAIMERATAEARERVQEAERNAESMGDEARQLLKVAKWQAENAIEEARKEAKEAVSKTRKETREKRAKAEAALELATRYAAEIRRRAEQRAEEIAGEAYEARGKVEAYRATAVALKNRIEKYEGIYMVPPSHVLDELAEEFGHSTAGDRLKLAREQSRLMRENGTAASCGYIDGWKKDHALKFVLNTFDGKVDTVLSRVRPGNQGKLIQEIRACYELHQKWGAALWSINMLKAT
jgi:vacuolar-type H+-ATPase subunit H